jgi:hypothetical protein
VNPWPFNVPERLPEMDHPVFPRKFAPVNQYTDTLGRIRKILMGWKTEFDVAQKESRFVHALGHAPDLLHPVITGDEVNFSHSGHTGDVIYAMPAMYALANGRKINLYLRLNQPATEFTKKMRHPNGNVMLTEKSVQLFSRSCLPNPASIYLPHWAMKKFIMISRCSKLFRSITG